MATSIESRVPFLDHKLVEFAAAIPDEWKLSGFTTKRVLREAMKGVLPDSILSRPKMGFPVPFARWTREQWNGPIRDVLLDRRTRERGIVDPAAVEQLIADHQSRRTDGWDRLWMLLNLELWFRTFVDGEGVQTLPEPARAARGVRVQPAETVVASSGVTLPSSSDARGRTAVALAESGQPDEPLRQI
jgi:asparagine synthase (glutamine-hydrolysing)